MRHRVAGKRLSRDTEHRLAMRRNLVASLFEHETVSTTIQKAKEVKPFAEKLITLAKKGTLTARRRAIAMLGNRDIVKDQDGELVKTSTVIQKLFSEIGPRYLDRHGGYTRIIHLPLRRLGDNGQLCLLQLVGSEEKESKKHPSKKSRKKEKAPEAEALQTEEVQEIEEAQQPPEAEQAPESESGQKAPELDEPADTESKEAEDSRPEDKKDKEDKHQ